MKFKIKQVVSDCNVNKETKNFFQSSFVYQINIFKSTHLYAGVKNVYKKSATKTKLLNTIKEKLLVWFPQGSWTATPYTNYNVQENFALSVLE